MRPPAFRFLYIAAMVVAMIGWVWGLVVGVVWALS